MRRASPLPEMGRGTLALFAGPTMGPAVSTLFPSPWVGSGRSHVLSQGPYPGASSVTVGQATRTGEARETEETGQVPPVSTVMTGAPSTMTDQSPAQAEARPST